MPECKEPVSTESEVGGTRQLSSKIYVAFLVIRTIWFSIIFYRDRHDSYPIKAEILGLLSRIENLLTTCKVSGECGFGYRSKWGCSRVNIHGRSHGFTLQRVLSQYELKIFPMYSVRHIIPSAVPKPLWGCSKWEPDHASHLVGGKKSAQQKWFSLVCFLKAGSFIHPDYHHGWWCMKEKCLTKVQIRKGVAELGWSKAIILLPWIILYDEAMS